MIRRPQSNEPWHVFLLSSNKFCGHYECRGTQLVDKRNLSSYWNQLNEQVQCRGTSSIGARNLSGCRMLFASSCGYPGALTVTDLSR